MLKNMLKNTMLKNTMLKNTMLKNIMLKNTMLKNTILKNIMLKNDMLKIPCWGYLNHPVQYFMLKSKMVSYHFSMDLAICAFSKLIDDYYQKKRSSV